MKINSINIKKLNNYRDYDINFNNDITFITGINGSGKTSILNMIMNLMTPSLKGLAETSYKYACINFEVNNIDYFIKSEKIDNVITLEASNELKYSYRTYEGSVSLFENRTQSNYEDYYRDIINKDSDQEFFSFIKSIPNPSYLSLDRKTNIIHNSRNIIGATNSSIIQNSKILAERSYRRTIIEKNNLGRRFQEDILNTLLSVDEYDVDFEYPTNKDMRELGNIKRYLSKLPSMISIDINILEKTTIPFITRLEELGKSLPIGEKFSDTINKEKFSKNKMDIVNNVFKWSQNKSQIKNIKEVAEKAEKLENDIKLASSDIDQYIEILNEFFKESGKNFSFGTNGRLTVETKFDSEPKPLKYLSSGELQILSIITNLCLDRSAKRSNIFIIDEPELSLHVDWQEIFVDSLIKSNSNIQYIMATHSPAIILDKVKKCIDISVQGEI